MSIYHSDDGAGFWTGALGNSGEREVVYVMLAGRIEPHVLMGYDSVHFVNEAIAFRRSWQDDKLLH